MKLQDIVKSVDSFLQTPPTFENMTDLVSIKGGFPTQCNTNINEETKQVAWGQLIFPYKSSYSRIDDRTGESIADNATQKTLVVKFPRILLEQNGVSSSEFKNFFDTYFVNKARLLLPVSDERDSYKSDGKTRVKIPNQSEVTVSKDFDLRAFINSYKQDKKS